MTAKVLKIGMLVEQLPEHKQDALLTVIQSMFEMGGNETNPDPDEMTDINSLKVGNPVALGGWEGLITVSDDFDAPLDDFEEYM